MIKAVSKILLAAALSFGTASVLAASHTAAEKSTTWEDVKAWSHDKKNDAVAAGKKMIAATDKKMKELDAAAKKAGSDTGAAHRANMKELEAKKVAAAARLAEMQKAGAKAWDSARDGFATAYKDLTESQDKANASVSGKR